MIDDQGGDVFYAIISSHYFTRLFEQRDPVIMKNSLPKKLYSIDILISFFVFLLLLAGTFGLLVAAPYTGFYFNPTNGEIVDTHGNDSPKGLQKGDVIKQIGDATWKDYQTNKYLNFFEGSQPGQVYEITVQRGEKKITVSWILPGFNEPEFKGRFFSTWWLSFLFWAFGFLIQRYIRPRDLSWRLLVTLNYLLAVFISFGNFSAFHVLAGPAILRAVAWLLVPIFIQLHWIFPYPLRNLPKWVWTIFYLIFIALAAIEFFPILPAEAYFFGLLLAFGGGLALLVVHWVRQPKHRSDLGLIGGTLMIALLPIISISLAGLSGKVPVQASLVLFALTVLPFGYIYAINRRRMGNLELRASRAISVMAYSALLASVLPFVVSALTNSILKDSVTALPLLIALATAILTVFFFPFFQTQIEQHVLGITLPHQKILETYATSITSSANLNDLLELLNKDIFNSLQVQQYAFILKTDETEAILLSKNVTADQVQVDKAMELIDEGRAYRLIPPSNTTNSLDWIRLILPLKMNSKMIGLWLLGRRDPDDLYPQADLPTIQSLANQTAIALSNLLQTERLKSMYRANVDRYEQERLRLALELHDSVLNEMAALLMFLDPSAQTPNFQSAYDTLVHRLREIVTELRPPMMNYGFKLAMDELADHLSEIHNDLVLVEATVQGGDDAHYPQSVEHHIYRMVQEASENAIRHGKARHVLISGSLDGNCIDLSIEDDGSGFDAEETTQLDHLVAQKHFGLAGMMERAQLIGAEVRFNSLPKQGTRVTIQWKSSS
jgi:signal transduction histidine kinase